MSRSTRLTILGAALVAVIATAGAILVTGSNSLNSTSNDAVVATTAEPTEPDATGGDASQSAASSRALSTETESGNFSGEAATADMSAAGPGTPTAVEPVDQSVKIQAQRDIIYTGMMTVEVKNLTSKATEAKNLVKAGGGWLAEESSDIGDDYATSVFTFRVAPKQFDATMESLSKLGKLSARSVETSDVTGTITDIEGRIKTLETSIARLRGFLDKATDPNQIGYLESELLRRETDLETLRGQVAGLEAQVAESTITLTLRTEDAPKEAPKADEGKPGFSDGLQAGWRAFVNVVNAVVIALAALLPVFVLVALIIAVVRLVRRRRQVADGAPSTASGDNVDGDTPAT